MENLDKDRIEKIVMTRKQAHSYYSVSARFAMNVLEFYRSGIN